MVNLQVGMKAKYHPSLWVAIPATIQKVHIEGNVDLLLENGQVKERVQILTPEEAKHEDEFAELVE